jgi:hypothetical protein
MFNDPLSFRFQIVRCSVSLIIVRQKGISFCVHHVGLTDVRKLVQRWNSLWLHDAHSKFYENLLVCSSDLGNVHVHALIPYFT